MPTKRAFPVLKVNKVIHRRANRTFNRSHGFTTVPLFIIDYRKFVDKFEFGIPDRIHAMKFGLLAFVHDEDLSMLLYPWGLGHVLTDYNITRRGLATMGVYHNPKLRGKQWVSTLTVNKIKSITTHETEHEANEHFEEIQKMVEQGTFFQMYEPVPKENLPLGRCMVDEGSEGERCPPSISCKNYGNCLREAWKYNIKGWRLHDSTL
jgi:hypothetical protein